MPRGNLDHFAMIDNGGVYEHGIGTLLSQHLFQIGIKQFGIQMVFRGVVLREGLLRFDNRNQSGGLIPRQRCQESLHVAVHQTNNCHAYRRLGCRHKKKRSDHHAQRANEKGCITHHQTFLASSSNRRSLVRSFKMRRLAAMCDAS